jgi:hypothetical protein
MSVENTIGLIVACALVGYLTASAPAKPAAGATP